MVLLKHQSALGLFRSEILFHSAAIPTLSALIALSARGLSREDYSEEQIDAAVSSIYGVDSDLINDGTYFVAEAGGELIGCGGWSRRRTLFGGDQAASRDVGFVDPARDAAKIRAFFVHPNWARRCVGRSIPFSIDWLPDGGYSLSPAERIASFEENRMDR